MREHVSRFATVAIWIFLAIGVLAYVAAKIDFFSGYKLLPEHWYAWVAMVVVAVVVRVLARFAEPLE